MNISTCDCAWERCIYGAEETLQLLAEQVEKFGLLGPLVMCGDFNAKCEDLDMDCSEGVPVRNVIDVVKNSQGEAVVDFLRDGNMTV